MPISPAVKTGHPINSMRRDEICIQGPKSSDQCDGKLLLLQQSVPKIETFNQ